MTHGRVPLAISGAASTIGGKPVTRELVGPQLLRHFAASAMQNVATPNGGENQSTVVAPAPNTTCPSGRILITNDHELYQSVENQVVHNEKGALSNWLASPFIVTGVDLDTNALHYSNFEAPFPTDPSQRANYYHAGQDHDIVALPDGSVVLAVMGESIAKQHTPFPDVQHDWFNWAYTGNGVHIDHGPGVRTVIYLWKSTDCGETFRWIGVIDPASTPKLSAKLAPTDGACAMPQAPDVAPPFFTKPDDSYVALDKDGKVVADANGRAIRNTAGTPGASLKGFNQGGTDGPLLGLDRRDGSLYVTYGCVGQVYQETSNQPYGLGAGLNKTLIYRSADGGQTWRQAGEFPQRMWRSTFTRYGADHLAFLSGPAAMLAKVQPDGALVFDPKDPIETTPPLPNVSFWPNGSPKAAHLCLSGNFEWSTFLTRGPRIGANPKRHYAGRDSLLFTYPTDPSSIPGATVGKDWGAGQDLILYDPATNGFTVLDPVVPASHSPKDYVVHLEAIDLGSGPVLLYWMDVSSLAQAVTVRGRFVFDNGDTSEDFVISQRLLADRQLHPFAYQIGLCPNPGAIPWFGDYHTASGFVSETVSRLDPSDRLTRYSYLPMWVDPAHGLSWFARLDLSYAKTTAIVARETGGPMTLRIKPAPAATAWRPGSKRASIEEISRLHVPSEQEEKARH